MYRVELSFDSDRLEQDVLERLYKKRMRSLSLRT